MESSQTLFLMHIMDGYSFRNTIGIVKSETDYATIIISQKSLEISFLNTSKCAVHKIMLQPHEFTMFRYNIRDENDELVSEYPIAFDTNEMYNTTKGIGRRDGIRLYWLSGENKFNVQPIKISTKDPGRIGALFVRMLNMEHTRYDSGTYNSEPNVRIQAKDFADICSQANTLKSSNLEIVGQENGVIFKAIMPNQTVASIHKFVSQTTVSKNSDKDFDKSNSLNYLDDVLNNLHITPSSGSSTLTLNVVNTEDSLTVKVPISTVKALSKIHNISPSGSLLRFYFSSGKPTKIESPIGTYGNYSIFLRPPSSK